MSKKKENIAELRLRGRRHGAYDSNERINPIDPECPIVFIAGLNKKGKIQILQEAMNFVEEYKYNSEDRTILITSSERPRAVESKNITEDIFRKNGIEISSVCSDKLAEIAKLAIDAELTGSLLEEYSKQQKQDPGLTWMEFWAKKSHLYLNSKKVETYTAYRKKMRELVCFTQKFSQSALGKNIDVVLFFHEEGVKIISGFFGITLMEVPNATGFDLTFNPKERIMEIEVQGQKGSLTFDELDKQEEEQ